MNVGKQVKEVVEKLRIQEGQCKYLPEDDVKKENEKIIAEYKKKIQKAKQYLIRLIEAQKKCIKHLVD